MVALVCLKVASLEKPSKYNKCGDQIFGWLESPVTRAGELLRFSRGRQPNLGHKASAWTGVITGLFGLLSLTGFFPLVMANALGATLWFFLVGSQLLRLGSTRAEGKE
jgi:hypothetical protein